MDQPNISTSPLDFKLPDEIIEEARRLYNTQEAYQWEIGDFLAGVVDEVGGVIMGAYPPERAAYAKSKARVEIIRQLADSIGCDRSTLRDRESMARFFSQADRDDFAPLTYHQMRACKAAGSERWRGYAEWALANLPAPVAVIRARVKANGAEAPAWIVRWQRLASLAGQIAFDDQAPPAVRKAVLDLLDVDEALRLWVVS